VIFSGPPEGLESAGESLTAEFMFPAGPPPRHVLREPQEWRAFTHLTRNNLQDVSVKIPIGVMTTITGVSGSGKSSLLAEIIDRVEAENETALSRQRIISIDQKPIGRSPRSNLATYTGLFDTVRQLFAATPDAKARHYTASRFSFNVEGGRCPTCRGEGFISIELIFMPDDYSPCPTCHGARYNPETLDVHYDALNIAEVLAMTVTDAREFFEDVPAVSRALTVLIDVGLGYLTLGQPATELSGGEAQRIKLATELQRPGRVGTIFVLDEPTGGLHPANVRALIDVFETLTETGNTVIAVEHNMDVVAASDWIIELGPAGGDKGGRVVASGTPDDLLAVTESVTAPYLAQALAG
jgi:excinuclease ABC subunit A